MTAGVDQDAYLDMNLVGTPDQVCDKIEAYRRAGLDHLSGLLFVGNPLKERCASRFACSPGMSYPPSRHRPDDSTSAGRCDTVLAVATRQPRPVRARR